MWFDGIRSLTDRLKPDREGLPPADPVVERICSIVAAIATVWFFAAAAWEIAGPFGAGHYAASGAVCVGGENSFRWGILGAVTQYTLKPPSPSEYYCHHPWGIFWVAGIFVRLFGHHDWACRLPAVLQSALTPPLLYMIGRAAWSPVAGAVGALSFVTLPIALSYASFNALEVPVIFGVLVACWGYVRLTQTWRRRWIAVGLFGMCYAMNSDWPGVFFVTVLLAFLFLRGFVFRRWFSPVRMERFGLFWSAAACGTALLLATYCYWFYRAGHLNEWLASGIGRSSGSDLPLGKVLLSRRYWIELAFTPLAILLGKVALPVLAARVVIGRSDRDFLPIAVLAMAVVQYVVFKQGADIHFFWPHYFAPYFALAMAALAATGERWAAKMKPALRSRRGSLLCLALSSLLPLSLLRDGVAALSYARATGGRFNEKGLIIHPDKDKATMMKWLSAHMQSHDGVLLDLRMKQTLADDWVLRRPVRTVQAVPATPGVGIERYFLTDSRFMRGAELQAMASRFRVQVVGPFWVADRAAPPAALDGFAIERRAPSVWEWLFVSGAHDLHDVAPDPFITWELRDHLQQQPNPSPAAAPLSHEQLRIAHNMAVARGDSGTAAELLDALLRGVDRKPAVDYSDGTALLGARYEERASALLTVYFRAAGQADGDRQFSVRGAMIKKMPWSLVPADGTEREVGMQPAIPPALWKPGYIYTSITEVLKRPGTERLFGYWKPSPGKPPPKPLAGPEKITLAIVH